MTPLVDTHSHIGLPAFDEDREAALERAREAGLVGCVAVAVDPASARRAAELADADPLLVPTAGIHPTEPLVGDEEAWVQTRELLAGGRFAAVGETGLDAFHDPGTLPAQTASLRRHLDLALDLGLPAIVHCRDAFGPLIDVLADYRGAPLRGVLHCYTGTRAELGPVLDAGLHVGIGGIATFKGSTELRAAVAEVPDERLLLETDAPWLAPVPRRGRRNEPAYVAHVCDAMAPVRGTTPGALGALTTANARALFARPFGAA